MGTEKGWTPDKEAKTNELKAVIEPLRIGHGLLSKEQFLKMLMDGTFEIWRLPHNAYALISWGECEHGTTCNIMTTCGNDANDLRIVNDGMEAIERIARERGARVIISVGRPGYKRAALNRGYIVQPCILMKKVLES